VDNAARLDQELSAIKERYQALVTNCKDRQSRLEEAVPLAERFHDVHEQLSSWLQHVEPELQSGKEPTGPDAEKQLQVSCHLLQLPTFLSTDCEHACLVEEHNVSSNLK